MPVSPWTRLSYGHPVSFGNARSRVVGDGRRLPLGSGLCAHSLVEQLPPVKHHLHLFKNVREKPQLGCSRPGDTRRPGGQLYRSPRQGALVIQVIGHQDDEVCSWTAHVPSRAQMQEDCVRGSAVAHQASDAMQVEKKAGEMYVDSNEYAGARHQLWNTYAYEEVMKAVVAGVEKSVHGVHVCYFSAQVRLATMDMSHIS